MVLSLKSYFVCHFTYKVFCVTFCMSFCTQNRNPTLLYIIEYRVNTYIRVRARGRISLSPIIVLFQVYPRLYRGIEFQICEFRDLGILALLMG